MILPNVDWFQATIDIENYNKVANALLLLLEDKKNEASYMMKESMDSNVMVELRSRLNEPRWIDFKIQPNGAPRYAYILHNDSFEIKIAKHRAKSQEAFPLQVRIKSELLWALGVNQAWEELRNIISSSFGKIKATKISRIDLACHTDLIDFDISSLEKFKGNHISDQIYRENRIVTGLSFGSRNTNKVNVRIYDKTVEVKKKGTKNWFFDIWEKHNALDHVWNIEYELKREFFKEMEIETAEQALLELKSLWRYCTEKHLVLTNADTSRIERAEIDSQWIEIQNAFNDYRGSSLTRKHKQLSDNAEALIPAICGYITSYASKLGMIDFDEIMDELKAQGLDYIENKKSSTVQAEITHKAKMIYTSI